MVGPARHAFCHNSILHSGTLVAINYGTSLHKWLDSTPRCRVSVREKKKTFAKVWPLLGRWPQTEKDGWTSAGLNHIGTHPVHNRSRNRQRYDFYTTLGPERKRRASVIFKITGTSKSQKFLPQVEVKHTR